MHADLRSDSAARAGLALARLCLGVMFLSVFFENYGKGLYTPDGYAHLIRSYIDQGHAPHVWKLVMAAAADHARIAAPLQALAEASFGLLLTLGLFTRPAACAAGLFLASLWLSEWGTAWIWELLVPTWVAFALSVGRAGRYWGLDSVLAHGNPDSPLW